MTSSATELVEQLRARGVLAADAPALPSLEGDRPWFIALMLGVAGWLAGILMLVFIGITLKPTSSAPLVVIGFVLLALAWAIYLAEAEGAFLEQFALAISVAGQVAVCIGVNMDHWSATGFAATALAVQLLVFIAMRNAAARVLAVVFGLMAWLFLVRLLVHTGPASDLFDALLDGRDANGLPWVSVLTAWLVGWLPVIVATIWLIRREPAWMASGGRAWARPWLNGSLLMLALAGWVSEPFLFLDLAPDTWGRPLSWAVLFPLLTLALVALSGYGAFRLRSPGMLGLAILGGLLTLSRFYYFFGTTLLWKSLVMLVTGSLLLLAGLALQRLRAEPEAS